MNVEIYWEKNGGNVYDTFFTNRVKKQLIN